MQADVFSVPMTDGAEIVIRHYSRPGALRLYITHGNGFAVDGYRIFGSRFWILMMLSFLTCETTVVMPEPARTATITGSSLVM